MILAFGFVEHHHSKRAEDCSFYKTIVRLGVMFLSRETTGQSKKSAVVFWTLKFISKFQRPVKSTGLGATTLESKKLPGVLSPSGAKTGDSSGGFAA